MIAAVKRHVFGAPIISVLGVIAALALLFRLFPGVDLWVAGWFHTPKAGFFLEESGFTQFTYGVVPVLKWLFIGAAILLIIVWIARRRLPFGISPRAFLLVVGTVALGAGILANTVFKDHWGRARPAQVMEFGGGLRHSPPLVISGQCARNCSFVSGHAALIFGAFGLALAFRTRRARYQAATMVALAGSAVGLGRMMQGAHFLSDILFAGLFCLLVALILRAILDRWGMGIDHQLRRFALRARRVWRGGVGNSSRWPEWLVPPPASLGTWLALGLLATLALGVGMVDRPLAIAFKSEEGGLLAEVFRHITILGRAPGWLILFGLGLTGFGIASARAGNEGRRKTFETYALRSAFLFSCVAFAPLINNLLMVTLGRTRPAEFFADGSWGFYPFSFSYDFWTMPSGQTAVAVALAVGVISLWPRIWALLGGVALLVVIGQLWLTMHYLSDGVVAMTIAVAVTTVIREAFRVMAPALFPEPISFGVRPPTVPDYQKGVS